MATSAQRLYKEDFYAWTCAQAAALRRLAATRSNVDARLRAPDRGGGGFGQSASSDAVRSQVRRAIIEHLLKLRVFSGGLAHGTAWYETVIDARSRDRGQDDADDPARGRCRGDFARLWQQARAATAERGRCAFTAKRCRADALPDGLSVSTLHDLLRHELVIRGAGTVLTALIGPCTHTPASAGGACPESGWCREGGVTGRHRSSGRPRRLAGYQPSFSRSSGA